MELVNIGSLVLVFTSLCCFWSSEAISDPEDFIQRYAMRKAREDCVGDDLTRVWEEAVGKVVDQCRDGRRTVNSGVPIRPNFNIPNLPPSIYETPGVTNFGGGNYLPPLPMGFLPESILNLGSPGLTHIANDILGASFGRGGGSRWKRSLQNVLSQGTTRTNTENFVISLIEGENQVRNKISNVTCVLRSLNVLDSNGELQTNFAIQATSQLNIDSQLKADMVEGAKNCAKFTNCIPPSQSSLIPFPLKRACVFLRCMQLKRHIACVKKDIRENISRTIPNSVRGSIGVEEITQRMLEVLMAEDVNELEHLLL